jgi:ABC-2 type transport system permease protein
MFRTIWSKSLREYRIPMLCWGYGLALLMTTAFASATPLILTTYASVAPSLRFLFDPVALLTPQGYVTARYLEVLAPVLLSIWTILAGARMVRGEEERGTMDVLLATPQPRARVILEKLLALLTALLVVALLFTLGIVGGEYTSSTQVDFSRAILAALNVILLAFFFSMLALLISQFTRSRTTAAGSTSGLMILAFMFDGIGRTVPGSWVQYFSPFYYYNLNRPLIPSFNNMPVAALLLLGLGLLFAVGSIALFAWRDSGRPAFTWERKQSDGKQQVERSLQQAERNISVRTIGLRALRSQGWSAFWWTLGILAWCGLVVLLLPSMQAPLAKALAQSPALAKLFSGSDMATNAGFLSELVFGFVPTLVVVFALTLALTWTSDLENGRLELLLGTPRSRSRMLLERFGAISLLLLLSAVLSWLTILVAAQIANLSIDQGKVIAASVSMVPPALIIMGLTYALAGRIRYGAVLGILTAYIVLAFLATFLQDLLNLPNWVVSLSVFHLYGNPITTGMDWGASLGMSAVALVLLVTGLLQFRTADIERG